MSNPKRKANAKKKVKGKVKQKQKQVQRQTVNVRGGSKASLGNSSSSSSASSSAPPIYIPFPSFASSNHPATSSYIVKMNAETQTPNVAAIKTQTVQSTREGKTQTPYTFTNEMEVQTDHPTELFVPRKTRSDKGVPRTRIPVRVDSSVEFEPVYPNGDFTLSQKGSRLSMGELATSKPVPIPPAISLVSTNPSAKASIKTIGASSKVINEFVASNSGSNVKVESTGEPSIPVSESSIPKATIRTIRSSVLSDSGTNMVGSSRPPDLASSTKVSSLTQSGIRTISENKSTFVPIPSAIDNRMTLDDLNLSPIPASTPERLGRRSKGPLPPGRFPITDSNQLNFS